VLTFILIVMIDRFSGCFRANTRTNPICMCFDIGGTTPVNPGIAYSTTVSLVDERIISSTVALSLRVLVRVSGY
jgi:hypothetical protein